MQEQQQSILQYFHRFRHHSSPREDAEVSCTNVSLLEAGLETSNLPQDCPDDAILEHNDKQVPPAAHTSAGASDEYTKEAEDLVRTFTELSATYADAAKDDIVTAEANEKVCEGTGTDTLVADRGLPDVGCVPAPKEYKPGVFSALVRSTTGASQSIQRKQDGNRKSSESTAYDSTVATKKTGWYEHLEHVKSATKTLMRGINPDVSDISDKSSPDNEFTGADEDLERGIDRRGVVVPDEQNGQQGNIVTEVAEILARRRFLVQFCDAFMKYGAPTHRLEDYMTSAARALEIDATFVYMPGTMTCTFKDGALQINSSEIVRGREGLDFARLKDAFDVYKKVVHGPPNVRERKLELDRIENRPDAYTIWFRILMFGVSSVIVGPFSFQARPIDFVPVFFLSCALGFLQLKIVPRSDHFSNVFEVSAAVVAAFAARGLGSIRVHGEYVFCFSATAQSSIALILPGFMILNSALELQGQSMVAGSVRMVYAVIYVLFLGFGLLIGMTLYGLMDRHAVTTTTCSVPFWFEPKGARLLYANFVWVPLFACSLAVVYRARWSQLPVMALISVCGYQAYYWMSTVITSGPQIANAIGAFVIGCLANIYSRIFKGPAATNMLPAIYCLVPGGLASSGSLVAGVQSSEEIVNSSGDANSSYNNTVFSVGANAVQICIGTSVGLYLSALLVYPYGKRRSGLFSFS